MADKTRIDYSIRFQAYLDSPEGRTLNYIKTHESKKAFEENMKNLTYIYFLPYRLYEERYSQESIEIAVMETMNKIRDLNSKVYYFFRSKGFSIPKQQFQEEFSSIPDDSEESKKFSDNEQEIQDTQELFDF